jgi:hypothetical protein
MTFTQQSDKRFDEKFLIVEKMSEGLTATMRKKEAEKLIRQEIKKLKPCPFCGSIPVIEYSVDEKYTTYGSIGHYAKRLPCCDVMGMGQLDLFFCNDFEQPAYELWYKCVYWLVYKWNQRRESKI